MKFLFGLQWEKRRSRHPGRPKGGCAGKAGAFHGVIPVSREPSLIMSIAPFFAPGGRSGC